MTNDRERNPQAPPWWRDKERKPCPVGGELHKAGLP
jgi:hypothetical protein